MASAGRLGWLPKKALSRRRTRYQVGALKARGMWSHTLMLWSSDNGPALSPATLHSGPSNAPFYGWKVGAHLRRTAVPPPSPPHSSQF